MHRLDRVGQGGMSSKTAKFQGGCDFSNSTYVVIVHITNVSIEYNIISVVFLSTSGVHFFAFQILLQTPLLTFLLTPPWTRHYTSATPAKNSKA